MTVSTLKGTSNECLELEKVHMIMKIDRQDFLMVPKSGQKLILIALQNIFPFSLGHPVGRFFAC